MFIFPERTVLQITFSILAQNNRDSNNETMEIVAYFLCSRREKSVQRRNSACFCSFSKERYGII